MKYRILVTKTLDVPKNVFTAVFESEAEATKVAQEQLAQLDGDVAVVMELRAGMTHVLQRFEAVRKTG